ncbi:MAG: glucose-1-phosphate thymidylyltransferase [Candidatus Bathyarchaeota archaeon B23]|nr:MAG: glucose-1-phosphate thymidylyltransferase [Candidatus Bathyarchaeota archaeon B23]
MKAVILAAGRGVRLRPFTLTRPKHLLPVGGRPLLEWLLLRLREVGVDEALIVVHHLGEMIRERLGDGSQLGLRLAYREQGEVRGTGDAFRLAEEYVGDEEFIGLYGDLYLSSNALKRLLEAHRPGETTMAVVPVDDPTRFGVVTLEDDQVVDLVEKPKRGEEPSNLANAGLYIFTPQVFERLRALRPSVRGEYEVTDALRGMMADGEAVRAARLEAGDWVDIGYPWKLLEANERALGELEPSVEGRIEAGAHLQGPVRVEAGARIRAGAYIEGPVHIGPGADIGPNCYIRPHSSIGAEARIGNGCEVKNSIILPRTHIAHLSYIGDSVIGEGCNLGAGTITANLRFDKGRVRVEVEGVLIDSGRRKLGAFIGDEAQTGIGVNLMPGVKVGPRSWIAPGLTVYRDVPPDTFHRG